MKWFRLLALLIGLFAICIPFLLSGLLHGWIWKYISPVNFRESMIPDLTGKVALVTGANTGIGFETARGLAENHATVILACRSLAKGQRAIEKINRPNTILMHLDLGSLKSVKSFAQEFLKKNLPLDMLILNAGIMKSPGEAFGLPRLTYGFELTEDGFEQHIGVNHIAHFYLTQLLWGKLHQTEGSRVISVASSAEISAYEEGMVFDLWEKRGDRYEDGKAYGQSKLANIFFAKEFSIRSGGKVKAYSLQPGVIKTELGRSLHSELEKNFGKMGMVERYVNQGLMAAFNFAMMEQKDGALNQIYLATTDAEELENGGFYYPIGRVTEPYHPRGTNETVRELLWTYTESKIQEKIGS